MTVENASRSSNSARRCVLLVEDGETNRMIARAMLNRAGFDVECAYDGAEAVTMVLTREFDAVLMDLAMPVMDGVEAARSIRQLPEPACDTPIIALTAYDGPHDRTRCLNAGMNEYLAKPLRYERLITILDKVTDGIAQSSRVVAAADKETIANVNMESMRSPVEPKSKAPKVDSGKCGFVEADHRDVLSEDVLDTLEKDTGGVILQNLISEFLREARDLTNELSHAKNDWEFDRHQKVAHSLKSSASAFGATALESAAAALERACMTGDIEKADMYSEKISPLFIETSNAFADRGFAKV